VTGEKPATPPTWRGRWSAGRRNRYPTTTSRF